MCIRDRYRSMEYAPDYKPNPEYVKKGLGSCGPSFEKGTVRKPLERQLMSANHPFFFLDDYKVSDSGVVFEKTRTPIFSRMKSRDRDPTSKLPSFMQNTLNTRSSLSQLNEKMLVLNRFSDSKFQTVTSGFTKSMQGTRYSKGQRKEEENVMDDDDF
eukprot:TRINITY_DN2608_c0_g1_i3.p1 TRINITY_DN2608_c0_g1~~TRINITY_DN2608_c0_g1_i3.p1  ORF type:complete len:157 (-),score=27.98 TRINITY_DN2608_c0_g1_i3:1-471(-)